MHSHVRQQDNKNTPAFLQLKGTFSITYHIFIIITVIVRLSCVGVAVPHQVLHSTAERTRHCEQTGSINHPNLAFKQLKHW